MRGGFIKLNVKVKNLTPFTVKNRKRPKIHPLSMRR